jgi:hypothetical protein
VYCTYLPLIHVSGPLHVTSSDCGALVVKLLYGLVCGGQASLALSQCAPNRSHELYATKMIVVRAKPKLDLQFFC